MQKLHATIVINSKIACEENCVINGIANKENGINAEPVIVTSAVHPRQLLGRIGNICVKKNGFSWVQLGACLHPECVMADVRIRRARRYICQQ